jgi:hypothetical protein
VLPLILYFKHNLRRQAEPLPNGSKFLKFSPLVGSAARRGPAPANTVRKRVAADIGNMIRVQQRHLKRLKARKISRAHLRARLWAASVVVPLLWSVPFADAVGLPPVPITPQYEQRLLLALLRARKQNVQWANTAIIGCARRSYLKAPSYRVAAKRCATIVRLVGVLCNKAQLAAQKQSSGLDASFSALHTSNFPKEGYSASLSLALLVGNGVCQQADVDAMEVLPFRNGTAAAIAKLTGDSKERLLSHKRLATLRLDSILAVIRQAWTSTGPRVARPIFGRSVLAAQLCQWSRDDYGETVGDLLVVSKTLGS